MSFFSEASIYMKQFSAQGKRSDRARNDTSPTPSARVETIFGNDIYLLYPYICKMHRDIVHSGAIMSASGEELAARALSRRPFLIHLLPLEELIPRSPNFQMASIPPATRSSA